jgi:SAM-dependent MidA family methyltransferase
MKEILKTARFFPKFEKALNIQMVEVSETMRAIQRENLLVTHPIPSSSESEVRSRLFDIHHPV